jgi:enoyl-CoA hydratase
MGKLEIGTTKPPSPEQDKCGGMNSEDANITPVHKEPFMSSTDVLVRQQGRITIVSLNRAQARNAVDRATAQALADAFRRFDADPNADVAVLHGEHGSFCAGADLKALNDAERRNRIEPTGDGPMGPSRMLLGKPVIAAIAGHAVAGGLELALWCDLRVMEDSAVMGVFCRRFGVPLIDGGTVRLPRLIGLSRALDLILTGRAVAAPEALAMGLANRVVPHGQALAAAVALAEELSRHPQTCMRNDRRSAHEQFGLTLDEALAQEFECGLHTLASGEAERGAKAFEQGAGRGGQRLGPA